MSRQQRLIYKITLKNQGTAITNGVPEDKIHQEQINEKTYHCRKLEDEQNG